MSSSAITGPIFSDVRRSPSGSAAAPSWAFNESTGTGIYLVSPGVLGLSTAGVQRVVVDASGNVGIGTASPGGRLDVTDAGGSIRIGNVSIETPSASGLTFNASNAAGTLLFRSAGAERMRIGSNGAVSIGTIFAPQQFNITGGIGFANQNAFDKKLYSPADGACEWMTANAAAQPWFAVSNAGTQNIRLRSDGVIFAQNAAIQPISSDVKLKENIVNYDKGLAELLKMKPRYYTWKAEPERRDAGFIAQEMDDAVSGSMVDSPDGHKTYKMDWYPFLVKAIQELSAKNDALEARLAALESK